MTTPASVLHLRIHRLVVDADAIPPGGVPHDLAARLQAALAPRLHDAPTTAAPPGSRWVEGVADALATRVREHAPGTAP